MSESDGMKQVKRLGWVSFFADVSSEMAYPVLPLFMRALGAPAAGLGLVEGVAEAIVSFMKGLSGVQSDRAGRRKPFIQWGYALSALGKPLIAAATVWPLVLVARGLDRVGKGIRTTARDALISESAPPDRLGAAFGLHRAMDTAGAVVGVLATLALLALFPAQYRLIFLLAVIPGAISVFVTRKIVETPRVQSAKTWSLSELKTLPAPYWHALTVSILFALANSSDTFLLFRAKDEGFSDIATVLMYAAFNFVYAALAFPTGKLSDRIGRRPVIAFGWVVYGLVYLGFAYSSGNWIWLLFVGYGLYQGFADGASKAIVADHSPAEHKGAAMGFFYMCLGFGTIIGNLSAGLLWDKIGYQAMFMLDGIIAVIAAIGLLTLGRNAVQK